MNLLAYVHLYVPAHNAGAEVMLHQILVELIKFGHSATVIAGDVVLKEYQKVKLINLNNRKEIQDAFKKADIVLTHLDLTQQAIHYSKRYNKPLVHLIHNDKQVKFFNINSSNASLLIANSNWIANSIKENVPQIIVYPPLNIEYYKTENPLRDSITLINLAKEKGSDTFWSLSEAMPNKNFIGVKGGYGVQQIPINQKDNVTVYEHTNNIKYIYGKTRILLVPSDYESWGRVALEACCSGIPVIAQPTPGLKESLSYAGIFIDRNDIDKYKEAILKLDDILFYNECSEKCFKRANEIEHEFNKQIIELNNKLTDLLKRK